MSVSWFDEDQGRRADMERQLTALRVENQRLRNLLKLTDGVEPPPAQPTLAPSDSGPGDERVTAGSEIGVLCAAVRGATRRVRVVLGEPAQEHQGLVAGDARSVWQGLAMGPSPAAVDRPR